jgi:hypothetical protein
MWKSIPQSIAWSLAMVMFFTAGSALAAEPSVYNKPIYDPATQSYIELVKLTRADESKQYVPSMNWQNAQEYASRRNFKGVKGRLAIIKDAETHALIMKNLRPSEYTWIGLRYICSQKKLQWADGSVHLKTDFSAWHANWDQSAGVGCQELGYMSVAYNGMPEGFRWVAKGALKLYTDLLVQYPTGQP